MDRARNDITASDHAMVNVAHTVNVTNAGAGARLTAEEFEGYSDSGALGVLRRASMDDRVLYLVRTAPAKAARLLALLELEEAVAVAAHLDPARLLDIARLATADLAELLILVAEAEQRTIEAGSIWRGMLGAPISGLAIDELARRGLGFRREHEKGSLHWSAASRAGMLLRTLAVGIVDRAELGAPQQAEMVATPSSFGTVGKFQRFQGEWDYPGEGYGATVYQSGLGTFATWGAIGSYFERTGGTAGPLGFPRSAEVDVIADGRMVGRRQEFEGGSLYWYEADDTVASVGKAFEALFAEETGEGGTFIPTSEQEPGPLSPFGTAGFVQQFVEIGSSGTVDREVWYSSERGTERYYGRELGVYEALGGPAGPLGYLVDGTFDEFEGGEIYNGFAMIGAISELWQNVALGLPTGPERLLGSGPDRIQFFERGAITVIDGRAEHWTRAPAEAPEPP